MTHHSSTDQDTRERWLRWYCHLGWRLLPVWEITPDGRCACGTDCERRSRGKHPIIADWPRRATADLERVLAWHREHPGCNWAWALDDHFILDDDPRNQGLDPVAFFEDWEELLGFRLPHTLVQRTGGGGLHVVFAQPPLGEVRNGKLYVNGRSVKGVDVKGVGGYVLVEPSNHLSGGRYTWAPWTEVAEPSPELLALRVRAGSSVNGDREHELGAEGGEPFDWEEALTPGAVAPGEQQDRLYRAACSLRARDQTDSLALPLLRQVVDGFTLGDPSDPWTYRHAEEMWKRVKREQPAGSTRVVGDVPAYTPHFERPQLTLINGEGRRGEKDGEGGGDDDPAGADDEPFGRNTDRDNAHELVRQFGDRLLWTPAQGWWIWDGKRLQHDTKQHIIHYIEVVAESLRLRARGEGGNVLRARALRLNMMKGVTATLAYAQSLVACDDELLDADPLLLNCPNGTLDLRMMELRTQDPKDHITRITNVDYDPDATSPLLDEYHETFMPDDEHRRAMYALLGACLSGGNDHRLLIMLIGTTTSGKSQLVAGLERALGDYAQAGTASIFRGNLDDRPRPDIMKLLTSRFALLEEAGHSWELHGDRIKHLTGGGTVTVRGMRSNRFVDRAPSFTPIIVANEMPRVKSVDAATQRRMRVVPFTHQPVIEDPLKKITFLRDDRCMRALLAQVIRGYVDQRDNGFHLPHEFDVATADAFDEMDDVREFVLYAQDIGHLLPHEGDNWVEYVRSSELHDGYVRWVKKHGDATQRRDQLSLKAFSQRLKLMGWQSVRSNGSRWVGWRYSDANSYVPYSSL